MGYLIGIIIVSFIFIIIIIGIAILNNKKTKNGVFQTITKTDTKKNRIKIILIP